MKRADAVKIFLLVLGVLALGGGLKALTIQDLKDFKTSDQVEADDSVPFPVDI